MGRVSLNSTWLTMPLNATGPARPTGNPKSHQSRGARRSRHDLVVPKCRRTLRFHGELDESAATIVSLHTAASVGLAAGSGVTFAVLRLRRSTWHLPLLSTQPG